MTDTVSFKSTVLKCASYDPSVMQTTVSLVSGKTYGYGQVSQKVWDEFKTAPSPGNYYNRVIRKTCVSLGESLPLGGFEKMPSEAQSEFKAMCDQIDEIENGVKEYRENNDLFAEPADMFNGEDYDPFGAQEIEDHFANTSPEDVVKNVEAIIGDVTGTELALTTMKAAAWIPEDRITELQSQVTVYADRANAIEVRSPEALLLAEDVFKSGKDMLKLLADEIQPVTKAHYDSWKEAKANENSILQPIETATERLSKVIYAYRKETERLAQQQQQALMDEARNSPNPPIFTSRVEVLPPETKGTKTRKKMVAVVDSLEDLILQVAEGIQKRRKGEADAGYPPVGCLEAHQATLNAQVKGREEGQYCPGVRILDDGGMTKTRGGKNGAA